MTTFPQNQELLKQLFDLLHPSGNIQAGMGVPADSGPGARPVQSSTSQSLRPLPVSGCAPLPAAADCRLRQKQPHTRRQPLPFLVNARADDQGCWGLPLALETLLFWAWQRWEVEVARRELKSNFGLGHKQCWQPRAAVASVQWSAWVYSVLLLAGYRTWGLTAVPTRWWSGSC